MKLKDVKELASSSKIISLSFIKGSFFDKSQNMAFVNKTLEYYWDLAEKI
ncbi:MAG: hypothetical protein ACXAEU_25450 [Candidatus Hodarchaeales archaeon]